MKLAPIAVFVYNRPEHAFKTLEAISLNNLADESTLFIFSDGPKVEADNNLIELIKNTREVIRRKHWCKEVVIIERDTNLGLSQSVFAGINEVLKNYESIIVLEDDIVTSPSFLKYMNSALDMYKDDDNIYQVSGFMIPNNERLPSTFFYRAPASWGWGTWKRAWQHYIDDSGILLEQILKSDLVKFNIDGTYDYISLLKNHWDARWYASIYLKKGLCLWPARSLTRNIGHDGTGHNCNNFQPYLNQKIHVKYKIIQAKPIESAFAVEIFKRFYNNRIEFLESQLFRSRALKKMRTIKENLKSFLVKRND